jgi:hypothetical protein
VALNLIFDVLIGTGHGEEADIGVVIGLQAKDGQ